MTALAITPQAGPLVLDGRAGLVAFDEAVPRFIAEKRAAGTRAGYTRALAIYRGHCAACGLSPFGGDAVQSYNATQRQAWQAGEIAADTVRLRFAVVKSFLLWCADVGLTTITAGRLRRWLHVPPARKLSGRDVLTADEAKALIDAARDERDRLILRTCLGAGLRVSECLALRPRDLWMQADRCYLYVQPSKGEKDRDVEIDAALYRDLARWVKERRRAADAPLFVLDRSNAWRMVIRTAQRAGITKAITPHSLRHTHAHHLRLAGAPMEVVSRRLGHASLEITTRYTRPAELEQAIGLVKLPWD